MIRLDSVSKQHGPQILFVDASAAIHRGEKVGLVGPNGAGKSTIFRLIMREESPDDGQVSIDRGVTIGYFSQDVGEMAGRTVVAETMAGAGAVSPRSPPSCSSSSRRWPIPARADELDALLERFGDVQARFDELGGYALEARAREILAGLGFSQEMHGRRRRRALGRLEDARRAGAHPADAPRRACCSTSRPTTSTSSRSSGSRASSRRTKARC